MNALTFGEIDGQSLAEVLAPFIDCMICLLPTRNIRPPAEFDPEQDFYLVGADHSGVTLREIDSNGIRTGTIRTVPWPDIIRVHIY